MSEKWDADRQLDIHLVGPILREQFPAMSLDSIAFLGSGWDFDAYLINEEIVVRFPRKAVVEELLEREERILESVGSLLGDQIDIPQISIRGSKGRHFPYAFFGHRYLKGVGSDDPAVRPLHSLARDIGAALTAIHSVAPTAELEDFFGFETETCRDRFEETLRLFRDSNVAELVPEQSEWLKNDAVVPPEYNGEARFIHNDLCPDHLIVDPQTCRLVGIIDWSDAAFGDPAQDFIVLVLWGGRDLLESILDNYAGQLDDAFQNRLSFLSRVLSIKWLIEAKKMNGDIEKHVRWIHNAFGF